MPKVSRAVNGASVAHIEAFPYRVRTFRDNGLNADSLPERLRIVYLGHQHTPMGGYDIAYVSPHADDDNGNETTRLLADALNAFLTGHPDRIPKHWRRMMGDGS